MSSTGASFLHLPEMTPIPSGLASTLSFSSSTRAIVLDRTRPKNRCASSAKSSGRKPALARCAHLRIRFRNPSNVNHSPVPTPSRHRQISPVAPTCCSSKQSTSSLGWTNGHPSRKTILILIAEVKALSGSAMGPTQMRGSCGVGSKPAWTSSVRKCSNEARSKADISGEATCFLRTLGGDGCDPPNRLACLVTTRGKWETRTPLV